MANKKVQIQIDTKATGNGAKQTSDDLKKLGTTADQVASKANTAAAGVSRAASARAAQVGFQVQDIAVQAQSGTAATTILAQQGSQLLSAFGPTGAILGGILAIGSAATGVFLKMGDDVESVEQKAEKLKEALEFVRENAEKLNSERIDMSRKAIEESIQLADLLRQSFESVQKAEQQASENALHNAEKLRLLQVEIRRLKGEEVDEVAELTKQTEYQIAVAEQARQKQIQAEQEKAQAALQQQQSLQDALSQSGQLLVAEQANLDAKIKQLEALKEQKKELEKIAKSTAPISPSGMLMTAGGAAASTQNLAAKQAKQTLAATPFEAQIQQLEGQINDLAKQTQGPLYQDVLQAAQALRDATAVLPQVMQETQIQIEEINKAQDIQVLTTQLSGIKQKEIENAKAVNEIIEGFVPATDSQAQALAVIKQKTSDLKITADEAPAVVQNLILIQSALTTSNTEQIKSFQSILQTLNATTTQLNNVTNQAKRIEAQIIR